MSSSCFDSWFPEACRMLTLQGAQILCHPANFGGSKSLDVIKVRALENALFTVTANRVGSEQGRDFSAEFLGESQIVGCDGEILQSVGGEETVVIIEIDPEQARRKSNIICEDLQEEWDFYKESHLIFSKR